jgi:S-adenosylmethionine hydrolase
MPARTPILTLTTDFGAADHYVGTMKGVILSICPRARIVDLCHETRPYQIGEAAFTVAQAYPYFPRRTVHVAVVDPGVGTARRPILVEAAGQYFIGPDNGVFGMVFEREKHTVREMTNTKLFLKQVSRTFHGRDVFAPAAAHLAAGASSARFGRRIENYLRPRAARPERTGRRQWTGEVLKADRFGNLITNFHVGDFPGLELRSFEMQVGLQTVRTLAASYQDAESGEIFLIVGSSGFLEVSVNQGSAAKVLGCGSGAPCELTIF